MQSPWLMIWPCDGFVGVWRVRAELLRLPAWRVSRFGLGDVLVHPVSSRSQPSAAVAKPTA
jgi:hypothetical protein